MILKTPRIASFFLRPTPLFTKHIATRRFLATQRTMDAESVSHTQSVDDLAATLKGIGLNEVPRQPNAYPEINPVDIYRSHITQLLQPISGVDAKIIYPALQWTAKLDQGDLVLPINALRLKGKKADEVAKELAEKFPESPLVQKPQVDGAYLRFYYQPQPLSKLLIPSILRNGQSFGFNTNLGLRDPADPKSGRKKVICEFSSPNIAKPFHVGHLRSTIIGGFLSNLYAAAGWEVIRMNYLGDWGKQYGILAIGYERFGSEEALLADPINHLFDVYVKVNNVAREEEEAWKPLEEEIKALQTKAEDTTEQMVKLQKMKDEGIDEQARKYFKRMVDGDPDALAIWKRFRDLSIERYKQTYARLNIRYDEYSGESMVKEESMDEAAQIMQEKGVSENSEGAVIVDLTKYSKKLGKAIVKKKDGTSLYLTRDIGEMWQRHEKYGFDKMIYIVASQQDLHLAQLFQIVKAMGREEVASKCLHINFGMVLGMSTRKGTVKFLDDILADVAEKMHDVMRGNEDKYKQVADPVKTADILGISAVMVQDMTGKR